MKMKVKTVLGLLFFGSLWGCVEAVLGGSLYARHVPHASAVLTPIAFLILALARIYYPKPGSSTVIGAVAMLFKLVNTPLFLCHLLAVFLDGLAFDVMATLLTRRSEKSIVWRGILGASSTYLGYTLFGITVTYGFRYQYWINAGLPRILDYVGITGSLAAAGACFTVPLGYWFGRSLISRTVRFLKLRPKLAYGSASAGILILWIVGRAIPY